MLDMKFLRENPEIVKENIKKKFQDHKLLMVDEVIELDKQNRALKQKGDDLRAQRNSLSKQIGGLMAKGEKEEANAIKAQVQAMADEMKETEKQEEELSAKIKNIMMQIPNIIDPSVPLGKDDSENVELKKYGEPVVPAFEVPYHTDIMERFDGIDLDSARKVAGNGFYYLMGDIARLSSAMLSYARDFMIDKGFTYCIPPFMIRSDVVTGVMSFDEMDAMMYKIEGEDLYLIGTSEHSMIGKFKDQIVTAAIKHSTPCGVAIGKDGYDSYMKAYEADPQSIFGGIVAVNYKVDKATAEQMNKIFLEIVAAPDFDDDALEILKKKKNLRILKLKNLDARGAKYDIKYLEGKVLVQELNTKMIDEMKVVTNVQPTKEQLTDMEFGMKVVKYVKSNAICIVKNGVTLAIGGGQTSRVWALENAIHNNPDKDFNGSVLASDAFFPFNDCVQVAADAGIQAIIQPGGSIRDQDSIDLCNEKNIPMVFSGYRHFRH